jgi:Icc-related predicted phosphoesterase
MRLLFTTDLHGSKWKFERLLPTAKRYGVDAVINGGDMLPKDGDPFKQGQFIAHDLDAHFAAFNDAGIYYLCYLGNDDLKIFDDLLDNVCRPYRFVKPFAQRKLEIGGYEFIGMNWVVDYPFRLKDRCRMDTADYVFQWQYGTGKLSSQQGWQDIPDWFSYARSLPTIESEMESLIRPDHPAETVYVIHMPPSDLGLDRCGHGQEVGSKAVYRFLLKMQPRMSLHGHIHESPEASGKWFGYAGRTLCIQPGQLDPFTYALIDLRTMEFERKTEARRL